MAEKRSLKGRIAAAFASLGCVGCLGFGAGGVILVLVVVVAGALLIQSQWQKALTAALDAPTGGEVRFEGLRLGLNKVTLEGVVVSSPGGQEVIRADELIARGNPWTWSRSELPLDGAELRGVHLHLHRDGAEWELPTTTLSLLRGQTPEELALPEVLLPELLLTDVSAEVSGPEGGFTAHIDQARVPDVSAALDPALRAQVGPLEIIGLSLTAPGAETLRLESVSMETDALSLDLTELPARQVRITGVTAEVGPEGWALPAQALGAVLGSEGIAWPALEATDVQVELVGLRATGADGGVLASVRQFSVPRAGLTIGESIALELEPMEAQGFVLSEREGATLATAPWARITVAPWTSSDGHLSIPSVVTGKAEAHARKGARYLGFRRSTWSLLRMDGLDWGGARIDRVTVDGATAHVAAQGGTLDASVGEVVARGVLLAHQDEPPWQLGSVAVSSTTATVGGQRVAVIPTITLGSDGTITTQGGEVWTSLASDHSLDLPPVVEDHVPTWLGGLRTESGDPWYGVDYEGLPWRPHKLVATGLTLHLRDEYIAKRPQDWDIALQRATIGPRAGDRLPIQAHLGVVEGEIDATGALRQGGNLALAVNAKKLQLSELDAYTGPYLSPSGLEIVRGAAAAELEVKVRGSDLTVEGDAHLRRLELEGNHAAGRLLAKAGNQLPNITVPVEVEGDLSDPGFSPMRAIIESTTTGLVGQLKGAAGQGVDKVMSSSAVSTGKEAAQDVGDKARDVGGKAQDKLQDIGSGLGLGRGRKGR